MARQSRLKVFRTPIGFHDAYVAASSQKAALEAWGSDKNLFSAGAAERVEDPELMREPLANPGKVIRRLRGTAAEHMAALPKEKPPRRAAAPASVRSDASPPRRETKPPPALKPKPRPSRKALDEAEAELAEIEEHHKGELGALARRVAELGRERQKLEAAQDRERQRSERRIATARDKYDRAMRAWRDS
jgi:hypothetical protein